MLSIASLFTITLVAIGALAHPTKREAAQVIYSCNTPNTVAITFDDGPYIYGKDLINTLNKNNIKATFFLNGNNYRCIYDSDMMDNVKYAYQSGHQLASHTWHHYNLSTLSWDQLHDEMWRVEQALQRIVGVNPAFMRPPYGAYNDLVRQVSGIRGQKVVIWDFEDGDSMGASVKESKKDYAKLVSRHPNNVLTLNHETHDTTVYNVIPYAIRKLKEAGYQFATVAECLGANPYQSVSNPQTNDGSWKC